MKNLRNWGLALFFLTLITPGWAQDWTYYGFDQGGSRFSPLDQINRDNIADLELAWSYRHGDLERHPDRKLFAGFHATPILLPEAAGRSLVFCTPFNRIIALDPATGRERWTHDPDIEMSDIPSRLKCLGVAYWRNPDAGDAELGGSRREAGRGDGGRGGSGYRE